MATKKTTKKTAAKKTTAKKAVKKATAKKTVKKVVPAKATKKVVKKAEPAKAEKIVTKKATKKPVKKVEEPKLVVTREDRNPIGGLGKTAKIFLLIDIILKYILIFPLAWVLPMHISYSKHITRRIKISTGYKVCVLLFVGLVPGILMLCDHKN